MTCPLYENLRTIYFKPAWQVHVSEQTFHSIMKLTDVDCIFSYIYSMYGSQICASMIAKHIFSGVKYVVGTRKNRLSETVLLSAQNRRLN